MTGPSPDSRVICRQCGTSNPAGDQFCGNCGAFLEWTAEPIDGAASTGTPATDVGAGELTSARSSEPASAAASALASPELVRCPTCGTANVAGKTFCLRCGNKLAGATAATRLPLPRPEPATPGASGGPTSAVPVPSTTPRRRQSAGQDRGGSNWALIGGAGIAIGAIVVAAVLLLGSGRTPPPAAASSAPSASAGPSASPSASRPAKTPKPTAKPKASK
jgi:hypothetical protein